VPLSNPLPHRIEESQSCLNLHLARPVIDRLDRLLLQIALLHFATSLAIETKPAASAPSKRASSKTNLSILHQHANASDKLPDNVLLTDASASQRQQRLMPDVARKRIKRARLSSMRLSLCEWKCRTVSLIATNTGLSMLVHPPIKKALPS
jgi:hypothetical protein